MVRRITVLIDDDVAKKLREKQAKIIKESKQNVPFSKVLVESVRESEEKNRKKSI